MKKQKAENDQATIIFCELITHLQIWQNNSEEAEVSFCSIFSQRWKQKCQKSICKACSDEISSQFHESSWFGLTVNKPLGRTSKSRVHWSQTLLCTGSDPTLNKGNEKPTGAVYPIAVEPLSKRLSPKQLESAIPRHWKLNGGEFCLWSIHPIYGVCLKPRDKFSPLYTAHLKNWCSRWDLERIKLIFSSCCSDVLFPSSN